MKSKKGMQVLASAVLAVGCLGVSAGARAEFVSGPFQWVVSSFTGATHGTLLSSDHASTGWMDAGYDTTGWVAPRYGYPVSNSAPNLNPASPSYDPGCVDKPGLCSYIWYDPLRTSDGKNGALTAYFRSTFTVPIFIGKAAPFEAILRLRADDDFEVFINGTKILFGMNTNDYGTAGDLGPDYVWEQNVTRYIAEGQENILAIRATDGSLDNPTNATYEHLAFELKLSNAIPEPTGTVLSLLGLGGLAGLRRRRPVD